MKKAGLELIVGVFVFVALGLLLAMILKTSTFHTKPGYTVRFIFSFVSGISEGSPVRLSGVDVGEVKKITVVRDPEGQTQVEVQAWIDKVVSIEEDADVRINSLGLLGEKYVEILPGTKASKLLSDKGTLFGKTPVMFEQLTESGGRLINKLESTVGHVHDVVSDPEFKAAVKATFVDAEKMFQNMNEASQDVKGAAQSANIILAKVREGKGTVGRLLMDDTIARDLEDFVKDIKAHPWKLMKRN